MVKQTRAMKSKQRKQRKQQNENAKKLHELKLAKRSRSNSKGGILDQIDQMILRGPSRVRLESDGRIRLIFES